MESFVVVGGTNLDIGAKFAGREVEGDSNCGRVSFCAGGVGRNIAEGLALLGNRVKLLSAVADDWAGGVIRTAAAERGIEMLCGPIEEEGLRTGSYVYFVKSSGEFEVGINDMEIMERITPEYVAAKKAELMKAALVVIDANIPQETIEMICGFGINVAADCVSAAKCVRLKGVLDKLSLIKANRNEAETLTGESAVENQVRRFAEMGLRKGIITLGSQGALCFAKQGKEITILRVRTPKGQHIADTNGCGDAFMAGFLTALVRRAESDGCKELLKKALCYGEAAAMINAQSALSVNFEGLKIEAVEKAAEKMIKENYVEQVR